MATLLHKGEEYGQSRKLEPGEVLAFALVSGLKATAVAVAADALVIGGRLVLGEDVSLASILLTTGGVGAVSFAVNLLGDLDTLVDGLRSFRTVETYTPPEPKPEPMITPSSPIIVKPYQGEPYVLSQGEDRPALPDGRNVQPGLNPETLSVVLREVLNRHDGQWSRSRLMSLRVNGRRITRTLYEQLTDALCKAGFLQERATGGYNLPPNIRAFEDLAAYFPRLPGLPTGGKAGGKAGRREGEPPHASQSTCGEVGTLAERHRLARFNELDYSVQCYLKREVNP